MSNNKLAEAIEYVESNHPLPRCSHGGALRDHSGEALEPPCGCRVPEAEVPQLWVHTSFDDSKKLIELEAETCTNCIPYVPASALAEVWKKAIQIAQAIRPDGSINFVGDWNRARKQFVVALEAARDAALSVGQKENKDES